MHYQLQIQNTSILFSYTYKPKEKKYIENEIKTVKFDTLQCHCEQPLLN
jgi:hypothetical protein